MSREVEYVEWKRGVSMKIDAAVAHEELRKIEEKHGGQFRAEDVVNAARRKSSPIHAAFEWDDSKAAEEHRKEQARCMVRSLHVQYKEAPAAKVRGFTTVTVGYKENHRPDQAYRTTADLLADPVEREGLLQRAINELIAFRKKYAALNELASVFAALEEVTAKL